MKRTEAELRPLSLLMLAAAALPCPALAQDGDYPAGQVLAAFATACSGVEDTAVNLASVETDGWERLTHDADTPISELSRRGSAVFAAEGGPASEPIAGGEFRKEVAGRTLYLAISGVRTASGTARGCFLFDFDALRALTDREIEEWAARRLTEREDLGGGASRAAFHPGLKPGHRAMEILFVPHGHNIIAEIVGVDLKITGVSLMAMAVEP